MQPTFEHARLTGFAILAVASATALSVGACSSSHDEKSPASSSSSSSPAASNGKNKDTAQGTVASVSGNAVQVTADTGKTAVNVGASANVVEYVKAQLSDVAVGNCVSLAARPAPAPGAPTAIFVQLIPAESDGKCAQPKPPAAGSPGAPGPSQPSTLVGTVAAVEGTNIKVTVSDVNGNPSQSDVSVNDTTQFSKTVPANVEAIAKGKCINAAGTLDGSGTLQATAVTLAAPDANGACAQAPAKQQPH
jgi:hypothetical protein